MDASREQEQELLLHPGPWKWLGRILLCAGCAAGGVWMIGDGDWRGWLVAVVFGLCAGLATALRRPDGNFLQLTREGFTVCSLYRTWSLRWDEVIGFRVARVGRCHMVVFDYTTPTTEARGIAADLTSGEAHILDTYGMKRQALVDLMNVWRERALSGHG